MIKKLTILLPILLILSCSKGGRVGDDPKTSSKTDTDSEESETPTLTGIVESWNFITTVGVPVYSTPILGKANNGSGQKDVVIVQGWDQFLYTIDITDGSLVWKKDLGGENYGRSQSADIDGNGTFETFASSHDGKIHSFNEDGTLRWVHNNLFDREVDGQVDRIGNSGGNDYVEDDSLDLPENTYLDLGGTTASAQIEIMTGTGSGQLKELTAVNGNRITINGIWGTPPDATSVFKIWYRYASDKYFQHAGTLNNEAGVYFLYVTGFDNQLIKLNAATGTIVWKYSTMGDIEPFPYVGDVDKDGIDEIITVSLDKIVHCVSSVDGSVKWKSAVFGEGNDAYITVADIDSDLNNEVLISSRDNTVYALNGTTGATIFQTLDTGGDIDSGPLAMDINNDGALEIFVGGDSGKFYSFDNAGAKNWEIDLSASSFNSTPRKLEIGGVKYIVASDMLGSIYILNPADGAVLKTITLSSGIEGSLLIDDIDNDGVVEMIVTSLNGSVYSYKVYSVE